MTSARLERRKPNAKGKAMNKRIELNKRSRSTRKLFVVDIENAVGNGVVSEEACRKAMERVYEAHKPQPGDLTVIGVSHPSNWFAAKSWNQGVRVVRQWGHDGADLALVKVLATENVEGRFGEVVIVSGDHAFAEQAFRLRALGVKVTVDARARQLSRHLALSCTSVSFAPSAHAA